MSVPLAVFFDRFKAAFEDAVAGSPSPVESRIRAGGRTFRIRFATQEMQALMLSSLEHLAVGPGDAGDDDFTIDAWDSVSTGVPPPPAPESLKNPVVKGELPGLTDRRFSGYLSHESGAISFYDSETRGAIFWMADARLLRGHELAAPFLPIFQQCFQSAGRRVAHAAVIGLPCGAALLAGKSGSGKSTTAALAREAGLLHLADDYCVVADGPPRAFTFYRSVKLYPQSLRLGPLAAWSPGAAWTVDGKNVLLLEDTGPHELPLKMILLPRVAGGGSTVVRAATAAEALRALAPSSLFQLPGAKPETFTFFAKLAKQLPAFHLDLGADAENIATRLRELLEGATP